MNHCVTTVFSLHAHGTRFSFSVTLFLSLTGFNDGPHFWMKARVHMYTFSIHILYIFSKCSHLKPLSEAPKLPNFSGHRATLYVNITSIETKWTLCKLIPKYKNVSIVWEMDEIIWWILNIMFLQLRWVKNSHR
jgi:hypothetical protein